MGVGGAVDVFIMERATTPRLYVQIISRRNCTAEVIASVGCVAKSMRLNEARLPVQRRVDGFERADDSCNVDERRRGWWFWWNSAG